MLLHELANSLRRVCVRDLHCLAHVLAGMNCVQSVQNSVRERFGPALGAPTIAYIRLDFVYWPLGMVEHL